MQYLEIAKDLTLSELASIVGETNVIIFAHGTDLEKWGDYTLIRPDPQVIWHAKKPPDLAIGRLKDVRPIRTSGD